MIDTIRKILSYSLYLTGFTFIRRKLGNNYPLILTYHRVTDITKDFKNDQTLVSASTENFSQQMQYLRKHYNVISLDRLLEFKEQNLSPPKNTVLITFDDGYIDNYKNAYPILKENHLPATIYLATASIAGASYWWEKARSAGLDPIKLKDLPNKEKINLLKDAKEVKLSMNWKQIKEMKEISFQAHTHNHPILTKIPIKEAENEIKTSKEEIEKNLKTEVNHFSYPNGHKDDFNNIIKKVLKKLKIKTAVTYIPGWVKPTSDSLELPRVPVKYCDDMTMFKAKLVGLDATLGRIYYNLR